MEASFSTSECSDNEEEKGRHQINENTFSVYFPIVYSMNAPLTLQLQEKDLLLLNNKRKTKKQQQGI